MRKSIAGVLAAAVAAAAMSFSGAALAQEKLTVWWQKGFYKSEDDALYAAKCSGRNRTVSNPTDANVLRPGPMAAELTRLR